MTELSFLDLFMRQSCRRSDCWNHDWLCHCIATFGRPILVPKLSGVIFSLRNSADVNPVPVMLALYLASLELWEADLDGCKTNKCMDSVFKSALISVHEQARHTQPSVLQSHVRTLDRLPEFRQLHQATAHSSPLCAHTCQETDTNKDRTQK